MSDNYSIKIENQEVVVRFNRNSVDIDSLTRFLDYLDLEIIRRCSQLTAEQAKHLGEETDQAVWHALKTRGIQE